MPSNGRRTMAAVSAAIAVALPGVLNIAPAHGVPLPDLCVPPSVVDDICTARLTSVTADVIDGTITGTPIGGGTAITLAGQGDAYLKSDGFGDAPPQAIQQWDSTIDQVGGLDTDPSDPNWYGNAKARVFLARTLHDLAAQFPPDIRVVRFAADDALPGVFRLVSIEPTPR